MFFKYNLYAIIWALCMFALNLGRTENLPNFPVWGFIYYDKLAHFLEFVILSFMLIVGLNKQHSFMSLRFLSYRVTMISTVTFAALLQLIHFIIAKEYFEWGDLLANILGSLCGLGIFYFIYEYKNEN